MRKKLPILVSKEKRLQQVYEQNISNKMITKVKLAEFRVAVAHENDRLEALFEAGEIEAGDIADLLQEFAFAKKLEIFPEEKKKIRINKIKHILAPFKPFKYRAILVTGILAIQGILLIVGSPSLLLFGFLAALNAILGLSLGTSKLSNRIKTGGAILVLVELTAFISVMIGSIL